MNLRELLEKATGEWIFDERSGCVAVYEGPIRNCLSAPSNAFIYFRMFIDGDEEYNRKCCETGKRIVALHNCAEELLSVVEAAENYTEHGYFMGGPPVQDDYDQLCAALAALREKEGKL